MRRLTLGIVLSILFLSCRSEQEITREEYVGIIRQVRVELPEEYGLYHSVEGIRKRNPLLAPLNKYFKIRSYPFSYKEHYRPWLKLRFYPIKATRRICRTVSVPFASFDKAHKRFGRENLRYKEELKEYLNLLRAINTAYKKNIEPHDSLIYRSMVLAYDLGFPVDRRFTVIDVNEEGTPSIDGLEVSLDGLIQKVNRQLYPLVSGDLYLLQIKPDPETKSFELFEIVGIFQSFDLLYLLIVSDSFMDTRMFLRIYPLFDLDTLDYDPDILRRGERFETKVFLHLTDEGNILLNSEMITDTAKLGVLMDSLIVRSNDNDAIITADDSVSFKELAFVCRFARKHGAYYRFVIPYDVIKGHEPQWDTEKILAEPPTPPPHFTLGNDVGYGSNSYEKMPFRELLKEYGESDDSLRRKEMKYEIWFRLRSFAAVTLLLHTCPWVFLL
ncbi:hypothetical protein JXM67_11940 [candidate division WOR-3 bacterium]|nr:hypothetical protein [candidate division WOR-3 bacterium]